METGRRARRSELSTIDSALLFGFEWKTIYGLEHIYGGPLFIHHVSQLWIGARTIRDEVLCDANLDYFENSRRAVLVEREYAHRNPRDPKGYLQNCWGITASDGPGDVICSVNGRRRRFWVTAPGAFPSEPTTARSPRGSSSPRCRTRKKRCSRPSITSSASIRASRIATASCAASTRRFGSDEGVPTPRARAPSRGLPGRLAGWTRCETATAAAFRSDRDSNTRERSDESTRA